MNYNYIKDFITYKPYKLNIFLKIDIEGGEYPFFSYLDKNHMNKFNQIIIEIHDTINTKKLYPLLNKLKNTHNLVHIQDNNYSYVFINENKTKILPNVIECTYLRKYNEIKGFNILPIS